VDGDLKACSKCGELKPLQDYYKAAGTRDGHRGECIHCAKVIRRQWYEANHAKAVDAAKRWQARNPQKHASYQQEYRNRPERKRAMRDMYYRRTFGITADDVDALIEKQGGVCVICGRTPERLASWHVDHCHETGVVRGILCIDCNQGIGKFHEDPQRLRAAADYLASASR
jgi:hypothetical protein